jgi:hypothetical protein
MDPRPRYERIHEIKRPALVDQMIKEGFDINAYDRFGLTPLRYCDTVDDTVLLLRNGADPRKRSKDCLSAIEACEKPEIRQVMLEHLEKNFREKLFG